MIGSPASAVPGAMPARMAAPRAAARWRARMGGATVAPESWCDADMPTKVQVQAWLDAYVAAWRSYERDAIVALFTDDVCLPSTTRTTSRCSARRRSPAHGWESRTRPARGRRSTPRSLIAGDEVIATGETRYTDGQVFSNLWQLTFAPDGRCSRFVEWYVLHRRASWGAGIRTPIPGTKNRCLAIRRPPRARPILRCPGDRSHRPDPRRGRGDPDALGGTEGAASAVRAPDDRVADRRGPRGGRRPDRGRRRAEARARRGAARGRRGGDPGGAQRHRRRRPLGGGPDRRRRHRARALRRRAADHRRRDHRARARPRGERRGGHDGDDGARGPERLRARDPRRGGRRRAGGGDQDARRRDARGGGDPRGQHRHLRVRGRRPARRR